MQSSHFPQICSPICQPGVHVSTEYCCDVWQAVQRHRLIDPSTAGRIYTGIFLTVGCEGAVKLRQQLSAASSQYYFEASCAELRGLTTGRRVTLYICFVWHIRVW